MKLAKLKCMYLVVTVAFVTCSSQLSWGEETQNSAFSISNKHNVLIPGEGDKSDQILVVSDVEVVIDNKFFDDCKANMKAENKNLFPTVANILYDELYVCNIFTAPKGSRIYKDHKEGLVYDGSIQGFLGSLLWFDYASEAACSGRGWGRLSYIKTGTSISLAVDDKRCLDEIKRGYASDRIKYFRIYED